MIYFLEDDPSIRKLVIFTLNSQGMEAEPASAPPCATAAGRRSRSTPLLWAHCASIRPAIRCWPTGGKSPSP